MIRKAKTNDLNRIIEHAQLYVEPFNARLNDI